MPQHIYLLSPKAPLDYDSFWTQYVFENRDSFEEYWSYILQESPLLGCVLCFPRD